MQLSLPRWWPWSLSAFVAAMVAAALAIGTIAFLLIRDSSPPSPAKHKPAAHSVPIKPKPLAKKKVTLAISAFATEKMMSPRQLLKRWDADIVEASKRFGVPQAWIRAVIQIESGGRTMLTETMPMRSSMGAMGLMQLMPETYNEMRREHRLGPDPYNPHDNILAGAAYLRWLRAKYGYPTMFAAYNDGPGNLEARMISGGLLPAETRNYLGTITGRLEGRIVAGSGSGKVTFTRPNGAPVEINVAAITAVRAALPDEYAPGVQTVIKVGRMKQGVRESVGDVTSAIRGHGGGI